jgi:hypothetical protein
MATAPAGDRPRPQITTMLSWATLSERAQKIKGLSASPPGLQPGRHVRMKRNLQK